VTNFLANVLLCTIGGTKKEATADHKRVGVKWRRLPEITEIEFDEPSDYNVDVEGPGEWTTSFEIWLDVADETAARGFVDALVEAEKDWNCVGEIRSLENVED
jgi:hypothetical protein